VRRRNPWLLRPPGGDDRLELSGQQLLVGAHQLDEELVDGLLDGREGVAREDRRDHDRHRLSS
jgi:hypothetical protein